MFLTRIKNALTDILFPPLCVACGGMLKKAEANYIICGLCFQSIPLYDSLVCPVCLRRLPKGARPHDHAHYRLAAATHYRHEKIQKLISQYKYEHWLSAADPLEQLFVAYLRRLPDSLDGYAVVAMPLHKDREFKRGFNQAAVLAHRVSRALYLPLLKDNFVRFKNTKPQAEQGDYTAREHNIKNVFHVLRPEEFTGKNILLVDDVWTSGATANEAVRTLKACGAKNIIAAVIARAR